MADQRIGMAPVSFSRTALPAVAAAGHGRAGSHSAVHGGVSQPVGFLSEQFRRDCLRDEHSGSVCGRRCRHSVSAGHCGSLRQQLSGERSLWLVRRGGMAGRIESRWRSVERQSLSWSVDVSRSTFDVRLSSLDTVCSSGRVWNAGSGSPLHQVVLSGLSQQHVHIRSRGGRLSACPGTRIVCGSIRLDEVSTGNGAGRLLVDRSNRCGPVAADFSSSHPAGVLRCWTQFRRVLCRCLRTGAAGGRSTRHVAGSPAAGCLERRGSWIANGRSIRRTPDNVQHARRSRRCRVGEFRTPADAWAVGVVRTHHFRVLVDRRKRPAA